MYAKTLFTLLAAACLLTPAWGQIKDGVAIGTQNLLSNGDDYDPPCSFDLTLPLDSSWNGNSAARAYYALGHGAVLNECARFGVTGHSSPNFLAWNCNDSNGDGSTPQLPQLIAYTGGTVSDVSINIGSATDAGAAAALAALDADFNVLHVSSVVILAPAVQTVSTSAAGTVYSYLVGPCVMVADDLTFN